MPKGIPLSRSQKTSRGTKKRMEILRAEGRRISLKVPYGYNLLPDGTYGVNFEEDKTIEQMQKWRKKGDSFIEISKKLNRRKIRTKEGKDWFPNTVRRVLERAEAVRKTFIYRRREVKTTIGTRWMEAFWKCKRESWAREDAERRAFERAWEASEEGKLYAATMKRTAGPEFRDRSEEARKIRDEVWPLRGAFKARWDAAGKVDTSPTPERTDKPSAG